MTLVYLDVETTGLDPAIHQVVELAYAVEGGPIVSGVVAHDLVSAEDAALKVCRYFERGLDVAVPALGFEFGARAALEGTTLVAANPAFDAAFLRRRWGRAPWKYRLLDVEAYAMPVLGHDEPKGLRHTAAVLRDMEFDIPEPDHTAAGDVATLRAVHVALTEYAAEMRRRF